MNTRAIVGILIVLAFIVFGATLYYSLGDRGEPSPEAPSQEEQPVGYVPDVVNALHEFKDGMHTVAGMVDVPTPCDLLEADAAVEVHEPNPDHAVLQFTTLNESDACAQVVTQARFRLTFAAGEDSEMSALWNGQPVRLNVVDVGPGESLDNFEEYFKG